MYVCLGGIGRFFIHPLLPSKYILSHQGISLSGHYPTACLRRLQQESETSSRKQEAENSAAGNMAPLLGKGNTTWI